VAAHPSSRGQARSLAAASTRSLCANSTVELSTTADRTAAPTPMRAQQWRPTEVEQEHRRSDERVHGNQNDDPAVDFNSTVHFRNGHTAAARSSSGSTGRVFLKAHPALTGAIMAAVLLGMAGAGTAAAQGRGLVDEARAATKGRKLPKARPEAVGTPPVITNKGSSVAGASTPSEARRKARSSKKRSGADAQSQRRSR